MADTFPDRLQKDLSKLQTQFASQVDVPQERQFIGFDAYQKAMDCLKPGDVAIFATPPAFRWVHFSYAIQKGLHVFMEKPLTADGPTSKRMFSLGREAQAKNLKVGVGLMSRHNRDGSWLGASTMARLARSFCNGLPDARAGGDISARFRNRRVSPTCFTRCSASTVSSGLAAAASTTSIHLIDQLGWMKNEWPVKAQALGGRHYRSNPEGIMYVDQNFDTYSVEYTYSDGAKFFFDGRTIAGCEQIYCSTLQGITKRRQSPRRKGTAGSLQACTASQDLTAKMVMGIQGKAR